MSKGKSNVLFTLSLLIRFRYVIMESAAIFQVEYDFQYYKMEMATDAQMLIFSEEKSNIMPADLVVPFQPSQVNSLQVITPETAEAWRCYLATCKSLSNSIGEELQQVLENDLVELRQTGRSSGSQDLSR